jgi:integrase
MAKERHGYTGEERGKWFCRITFTDSTGKRKNVKRFTKTESEAKAALKKLLRQIDEEGEKGLDAEKLTFNDLADHYEKHFCQPAQYVNNRKVSGLRDVNRAKSILPHFRRFFGSKKVRSITYGDLLSYNRLRTTGETHLGKPRSISTMNRELGILRRIFNIALAQGWLQRNPFNCGDALIQPSADNIREKILTLDEERRLLEACSESCRAHIKPIVIALLDTGARKGEMLKLAWQSVHFETRLITIKSETTKTLKGRQVAMTQRLFDELLQLWEQSEKDSTACVFKMKTFRNAFQTACKIAKIKIGGLDGFTIHGCRHTTATRLVQGQMPIQLVGKILGHQNVNTTFRYLSADEETLHQAASILDSIQLTSIEQNQDAQVSELIN